MSYRETLVAEINSRIDGLVDEGAEIWPAQWIAHEICEAHAAGLIEGEPGDFWRYNGYQHVRDEVRKVIAKRTDPEGAAHQPQLALPGFERTHLQAYYLVRRGGEDVAVHVLSMSDEEVDTKAAFLDASAVTMSEHAKELRRFKQWRNSQAIAAE